MLLLLKVAPAVRCSLRASLRCAAVRSREKPAYPMNYFFMFKHRLLVMYILLTLLEISLRPNTIRLDTVADLSNFECMNYLTPFREEKGDVCIHVAYFEVRCSGYSPARIHHSRVEV